MPSGMIGLLTLLLLVGGFFASEAVKLNSQEFQSEVIAADYVGESPGCVRPINGKTESFASLAGPYWEGGSLCDLACVELKDQDGQTMVLPVRDYCLCCNDNQIALSRPAYEKLGKNVKQIKWKLVKCNSNKPTCPETKISNQAEANGICPKTCRETTHTVWDGHFIDMKTCLGGGSAACTCSLFYGHNLDQCCEPDLEGHPEAMLTCRDVCKKASAKLRWTGIWRPRAYRSICTKTTHVCTCTEDGTLPTTDQTTYVSSLTGKAFDISTGQQILQQTHKVEVKPQSPPAKSWFGKLIDAVSSHF